MFPKISTNLRFYALVLAKKDKTFFALKKKCLILKNNLEA